MTPLLPILILGIGIFMVCMQVADILMHFVDTKPAEMEVSEPHRQSSTDWSRIMDEIKIEGRKRK